MADEVLSWTSSDPRSSVLFNSNFGVNYRFVTEVDNRNVTTTTLWRAVRQSREDRLAKFEWTSNGSLGRAMIGRTTMAVSELLRPVNGDLHSSTRFFSGPDGRLYTWASSATGECILYDSNENKVAFFRPVRPTRYQLGDVYGELHFCTGQSTGTLMHPPLMDMICMTAMAYRVLVQWGW